MAGKVRFSVSMSLEGFTQTLTPGLHALGDLDAQMWPRASMASATWTNPAMLAPAT